jgi:hypothetical protein
MLSYTISSKPYFWTSSTPAENSEYNKINTLNIKYINNVGIDISTKIYFNDVRFNCHCVKQLLEDNQIIGYQYFYTNPDQMEALNIKSYHDNRPFEIQIMFRFINEFDEEGDFYFETEGMKSIDGFFPKGSCLDNYKLIINIDEDLQQD